MTHEPWTSEPHPMLLDKIENERCPDCGTPGVPIVSETDHGTWRRLALLKFPRTYWKPGTELLGENDRAGDPGLKMRIKTDESGQHDAMVTWAVEGAIRWYAQGGDALRPSDQVAEDTKAWRKDADRILGFWDECIVADSEWCVLTTELFLAFNTWLKSNGHNTWSKETFGPRFEQHAETVSQRVKKARTRKLDNLSRYVSGDHHGSWSDGEWSPKPLSSIERVYQGVRFQNAWDKVEQAEEL
jgi:putative DNA primase/helicase